MLRAWTALCSSKTQLIRTGQATSHSQQRNQLESEYVGCLKIWWPGWLRLLYWIYIKEKNDPVMWAWCPISSKLQRVFWSGASWPLSADISMQFFLSLGGSKHWSYRCDSHQCGPMVLQGGVGEIAAATCCSTHPVFTLEPAPGAKSQSRLFCVETMPNHLEVQFHLNPCRSWCGPPFRCRAGVQSRTKSTPEHKKRHFMFILI